MLRGIKTLETEHSSSSKTMATTTISTLFLDYLVDVPFAFLVFHSLRRPFVRANFGHRRERGSRQQKVCDRSVVQGTSSHKIIPAILSFRAPPNYLNRSPLFRNANAKTRFAMAFFGGWNQTQRMSFCSIPMIRTVCAPRHACPSSSPS